MILRDLTTPKLSSFKVGLTDKSIVELVQSRHCTTNVW